MPWELRKGLTLSGLPNVAQIDKYEWGQPLAVLTLCPRAPHQAFLERVSWYSHIPLADGQIRKLDDIIQARDTALSMYMGGCHTVIHCMAGRNRSGLVGALVLMELDNLSGAEALLKIRELRPRSIDNIHFETFLSGLERPRASGTNRSVTSGSN